LQSALFLVPLDPANCVLLSTRQNLQIGINLCIPFFRKVADCSFRRVFPRVLNEESRRFPSVTWLNQIRPHNLPVSFRKLRKGTRPLFHQCAWYVLSSNSLFPRFPLIQVFPSSAPWGRTIEPLSSPDPSAVPAFSRTSFTDVRSGPLPRLICPTELLAD